MFCKKCGGEIEKNVIFCPHCGANLKEEAAGSETAVAAQQEEGTEASEKGNIVETVKKSIPLTKKQITTIAIAAVAVIFVIVMAKVLFGGSSAWEQYDKDVISLQTIDGELKVLTPATGKYTDALDSSSYSQSGTSLDGTTMFVIDAERTLYVLNKKGATEVESDVVNACMSSSGEGLMYITYEDDEYELFLYNVGKKKSSTVTDKVHRNSSIVISPDGKSVAYVDEDNKCHLYINGKESEDTIKEARPVAIADGGKYFYYVKNDNFYVVKKGSDAEKLGEAPYRVYFNKDMTQVLYCYNDKTYYCEKGKKAENTVSTKGTVLVEIPPYAQVAYVEGGYSHYVLGISDLCNLACDIDGDLYFINKKMEAEKIVANPSECRLSADGKALLYVKNGDLYRVTNMKDSLEPKQVGEELEVYAFTANDDLSKIYYINRDDELMYIKGSKKPERVYDDDVRSWAVVGDNLYFLGDYSNGAGTLFLSKSGDKREKVSSSDEVTSMWSYNGAVYYEENDITYIVNGKKATKVWEE